MLTCAMCMLTPQEVKDLIMNKKSDRKLAKEFAINISDATIRYIQDLQRALVKPSLSDEEFHDIQNELMDISYSLTSRVINKLSDKIKQKD